METEQGDTIVDVVCVWTRGGKFTPEHVVNLAKSLQMWAPVYRLSVLTDDATQLWECLTLSGHRLVFPSVAVHDVSGFFDSPERWCLLDAFRLFRNRPTVYLSLDTCVVGSLSQFLSTVSEYILPGQFLASLPYSSPEDWSSDMMAWNGDFCYLESEFRPDLIRDYYDDSVDDWIFSKMTERGVWIRPVGNLLRQVSYRYHCKCFRPGNAPPRDVSIVYFHGDHDPRVEGGEYWWHL